MPPRKPRTSKGSSATSVKEKAAAAHPAPVASTSGSGFPAPPTSNGSAGTSDPVKEKVDASGDVEMEVGTPVTIDGGGINVGDEGPAAAVVEDDSQDDDEDEDEDEDSRSNSEGSHSGSESEGEDRHDGMADDLDQLPHHPDDDDDDHHDEDMGDDEDRLDSSEAAALSAADDLYGGFAAPPGSGGLSSGGGGLTGGGVPPLSHMDAMAALSHMGFGGLRGLGGSYSGMTARLKLMLEKLKKKGPEASMERLVALQELAEELAIATEDSLAGYFQTDAFSKALVDILKGETGGSAGESSEDADMAAALAASMADGYGDMGSMMGGGDGEVEHMLLASRCLANLMEAMPGSTHTVVAHGAVPVLCAKLTEIQFIDLAEQSLSTLEKISEEMPEHILRQGGLNALLQYLDFFSTNVQRTAVTAAANCCRDVGLGSFDAVRDAFPVLKNVVSYPDQRVSEQAVLAITGVMDSYRHHSEKLEALVTADVLQALMTLLSPVGGAKISDRIFSSILKSFTHVARGSPEVASLLLDAGLADTVYGILVGVLPPDTDDEFLLAKELTDNSTALTQALMRKDKMQIQQTLDLLVELLPHLPKTGVFDSKLGKRKKSADLIKVKREESTPAFHSAGSELGALAGPSTSASPAPAATPAESVPPAGSSLLSMEHEYLNILRVKPEDDLDVSGAAAALKAANSREATKQAAIARRVELLHHPTRETVVRRFNGLMLPTLLEVYGASVNSQLREKALLAMLKIAHFSQGAFLANTLNPMPMASFLASILANRDQPSLVVSALQMADLLLSKLPDDYHFFFRREGVMHEINRMADQPILKQKFASAAVKAEPSSSLSLSEQLGDDTGSVASSRPGSSAAISSTEASIRDGLTWRARHIREQHAAAETESSLKAQSLLSHACAIALALGSVDSVDDARALLCRFAEGFSREDAPVSSFELAESGLVDALLNFLTETRTIGPDIATRRSLFSEAVFGVEQRQSAFTPLVKRLQDSLSRLETFEVLTANPGNLDDSRRGSTSMLGRQIKFRIVADEPEDIPATCSNFVVSIHAIATFEALDKYLRPRIIKAKDEERMTRAANGPGSGSRLSGLLAAMAGSGALSGTTVAPPSSHRSDGSPFGSPPAPASSSHLSPTGPPADRPPSSSHAPRRSSRLSGQGITAADLAAEAGQQDPPEPPEQGPAPTAPDPDAMDIDDDPPLPNGSDGEEIVDEQPPSRDEPPVTVEPAQDGSKMEVHTPQGTRIATPQGSRPPSAMGNAQAGPSGARPGVPTSKASYASAVKSEPKDWHLEFFINNHRVSSDTTVYGAMQNQELTTGPSGRMLWSTIHTLSYKRVPGPARPMTEETDLDVPSSRDDSPALPPSIDDGTQQGPILRLLRALHALNLDWDELRRSSYDLIDRHEASAETIFINNKLTAKLNRQLEEPMIVASSCLPDWACDLPQQFPFLFPFETRYSFLESTSFGYSRLIAKWLAQSRSSNNTRDADHLGSLGQLKRQKIRISRHKLLDTLTRVFEIYGDSRHLLELEYFDEVGTGLGPTLEFFALASKAFAEREHKMWRDHTTDSPSLYVFSLAGLFPAPMDDTIVNSQSGKDRLKMFKLLGQFMAKSLLDSRIVDISLSRTFARHVLDYDVPLTIASVKSIDRSLAASLEHLQQYATAKAKIDANEDHSPDERRSLLEGIRVDASTIDDLALDFTLPGYDIELKPGSRETPVTIENVQEYIELVTEWSLVKGVTAQIKAFKRGFSHVFPIRDMQSFTPDEIVNLFGNTALEDWSEETITASIKPDHGFKIDHHTIVDLIAIMTGFTSEERRMFLQFVTGSPKLPIGGFRGLRPPLTIVKKGAEKGSTPSQMLPSAMTCQNYLKLPEYENRANAMEKIRFAMYEGQGSFHLS